MKSETYALTVQAEQDFLQITDYFEADSSKLAIRFINAVEASCALIVEHPEIGRTVDYIHQRNIRRFHIKGFQKYVLFYRLSEHQVEVLRMCHGARDLPSLFQA